jgi:RNA polymerase sigma-70 factor (ECF subfamily)
MNEPGAKNSITERAGSGHSTDMLPKMQPAPAHASEARAAWPEPRPAESLDLPAVYEAQFDFVWRSARRLGVTRAALDDVVQEVFLIVHRKLAGFERRSSLRSWLFAITRRVVRDHRRSQRRRPTEAIADDAGDAGAIAPDERTLLNEQARLLHALLQTLDDDKREAFVLAELERMSGPEIADALQLNLNTAYARVRAARLAFEDALARHEAREHVRRAP